MRSILFIPLMLLVVAPGFAAPKRPARKAPARKPAAKTTKPKPKSAAKPQQEPPSLDQHPLIARLKQYPNGHGVVVFEPVPAADVPENAAEFGSGASRWLNLVVGGHGELSKTPIPAFVVESLPPESRAHPRLTLAAARPLRTRIGLTHAALGEIQKSGAGYRMVYRVHDLKTGAELGTPVEAEGDLTALTAALPQMAGELTKRLGVETPRVPPIGEHTQEFQWLGGHGWRPVGDSMDLMEGQAYTRLQHTGRGAAAPMFQLLYVTRLAADRKYSPEQMESLLKAWPENTLLLGELAYLWWRTSADASQRFLPLATAAAQRYPQNSAAQAAVSYYQLAVDQPDLARPASEALVRCNTADPNTWMALSLVVGQQADSIRNGRFANDVTPQEMERISKFYEEDLVVSIKAAQINPNSAPVLTNLSSAATFAGIPDLADGALQRSLEINPKSYQAVAWGLEMYQPKWYGDPAKLDRMAQLAVQASSEWSAYHRMRVALQLHHAGLEKYVNGVLKSDAERKEFESHPHRH